MAKKVLYFFVYSILALFFVSCLSNQVNSQGKPIQLKDWEYFIFEAAQLSSIKTQLKKDSFPQAFNKYKFLSGVDNKKNCNYVLFRTKLPQLQIEDPTVFIDIFVMRRQFEAYLNKELIYKSRDFSNKNFQHYDLANFYKFILSANFQNQYLYFLIYSNDPNDLGFGLDKDIYLASAENIDKEYFSYSFSKTIPGIFLLFVGFISFFLYFSRKRKSSFFLLLFGLMTSSAGLHVFLHNAMSFSFVNNNALWYYSSFISFFLIPFFICYFLEQLIGKGKYQSILIGKIAFLAFVLIAIILDTFQILHLHSIDDKVFAILLGLGLIVILFNLFLELKKGKKELLVIIFGFLLLGLTSVVDLLRYFDIYFFDTIIFHYGLFFFIVSVAYLLQDKYFESHDKLEDYAKELKNLNENLEMNVEERTAELYEKSLLVSEANLTLAKLNDDLLERNNTIQEQNIELEALIEDLSQKNKQISDKNQQLNKLNFELKNAINVKDKFFSIIAHDLKNPIAAIMLHSEIFVNYNSELSKEEMASQSQYLLKTSKKLTEMLDSLLNWARAQTGRINFSPEEFDCHELVNSTFTLLCNNAKKKNIKLINNLEKGFSITADKNMLGAIFRNLISNGIKFTYENGFVSVSASKDGKITEFTVEDNGKGIKEENKEKLFKLEENFSTYGTNNESGTGLGLLISKEFVEKHKGTIRAESQVDIGTKFIFTVQ